MGDSTPGTLHMFRDALAQARQRLALIFTGRRYLFQALFNLRTWSRCSRTRWPANRTRAGRPADRPAARATAANRPRQTRSPTRPTGDPPVGRLRLVRELLRRRAGRTGCPSVRPENRPPAACQQPSGAAKVYTSSRACQREKVSCSENRTRMETQSPAFSCCNDAPKHFVSRSTGCR